LIVAMHGTAACENITAWMLQSQIRAFSLSRSILGCCKRHHISQFKVSAEPATGALPDSQAEPPWPCVQLCSRPRMLACGSARDCPKRPSQLAGLAPAQIQDPTPASLPLSDQGCHSSTICSLSTGCPITNGEPNLTWRCFSDPEGVCLTAGAFLILRGYASQQALDTTQGHAPNL